MIDWKPILAVFNNSQELQIENKEEYKIKSPKQLQQTLPFSMTNGYTQMWGI